GQYADSEMNGLLTQAQLDHIRTSVAKSPLFERVAANTAAALRAGVALNPGHPYFSAEPPAPHLRLSFAAVAGTAEITEGVRRLRTACDEVLP
ncbi:hypothetical protein ACVNF4_03570, partial [Streptomyces sp. S6]